MLTPNNWDKYEIARRSDSSQIPIVDTAMKIYDAAGVLSESEYEGLQRRAHDFINKNNIDLAVVIINENDIPEHRDNDCLSTTKRFAWIFYNGNNFGKGKRNDGVILLIDRQNRKVAVQDFGVPYSKWHVADDHFISYSEDIRMRVRDQRYYDAINQFIDAYEADYQYDITFPWKKCIVFSLIITIFALVYEWRKYKSIFAADNAKRYGGDFNLVHSVDDLISKSTTRRFSPQSTSSGGGGGGYRSSGSSHGSSSGRSFGGGSGSF
jgi:uncharacterized protein